MPVPVNQILSLMSMLSAYCSLADLLGRSHKPRPQESLGAPAIHKVCTVIWMKLEYTTGWESGYMVLIWICDSDLLPHIYKFVSWIILQIGKFCRCVSPLRSGRGRKYRWVKHETPVKIICATWKFSSPVNWTLEDNGCTIHTLARSRRHRQRV